LFVDLSPFIPLSLKGEGKIVLKEGVNTPLKHPRLSSLLSSKGEEILERGEAPLLPTLPPSLIKERGTGG